jgi:hypothetical protein
MMDAQMTNVISLLILVNIQEKIVGVNFQMEVVLLEAPSL